MKKVLGTTILLSLVLLLIPMESEAASLVTGTPADYVIITVNDWVPALDYYVAQKTLQGYQPRVFTVEAIYLNYAGSENREKILNFIREAFDVWAISYVLLVGDLSYVPSGSGGVGPVEQDNYYARLDGPNDVYHDVYVGRLPASNSKQVLDISTKWADYETHGWGRSFLGLEGAGHVATPGSMGFGWQNSLYYGPDITGQFFQDEMNSGFGVISYGGHGAPSGWVVGFSGGGFDPYNMVNGERLSFISAIESCSTGEFGEPINIAKAFIQAPGGGAIGYIGANSVVLVPLAGTARILLFDTFERQYLESGFAMPGVAFHDAPSGFLHNQYNYLGDPTAKMDLLPEPADTTAPQVQSMQLSANNIFPGQMVTLTAAVTDNDAAGIVTVEVTKPDATIFQQEMAYDQFNGVYRVDLLRFEIDQPGNYSIRVMPKDISQNMATVQGPSLTVIPDTQPPQISSVSISPQPGYVNQTIQINVVASDNSGLVADIWADITKPNNEVIQVQGWDLFNFKNTDLPGTYSVVVHTTDLSGNEAVFSTSFELFEDNQTPVFVDYWVSDQIASFPSQISRLTSVDTVGVNTVFQVIVTDNLLPVAHVWAEVTKPDLSTTVVDDFTYFGHWRESHFSGTDFADQVGIYSIVFYAQDQSGNMTQSSPYVFEVTGNNQPPTILLPPEVSENNSEVVVAQGQWLEFYVRTFDPNGDAVSLWVYYTNAPTYTLDQATGRFQWTPGSQHLGAYFVTFAARDDNGDIVTVYETVDILVVYPPLPPATPGQLVATLVLPSRIDLTWQDHAVNETNFWIQRKETGGDFQLIRSRQRNITTYSDTTVSPGTTYTYRVYASNIDGSLGFSNEATPSLPNTPPLLDPIGNKSIHEGQLLQFTVNASDPDGDALTYSASNLPTGSSFDPTTRTFSWTPTFNQAGTYQLVFEVSDGQATDTEQITITVNDVPTGGGGRESPFRPKRFDQRIEE